ncbi:exonuclease [Vibrio phage D529]
MSEYFDYGGKVAEPENNFKLWATEGNKTALIDADLLPYRVGYMIDPTKELMAKELVADGICSCIEDTPQFEAAFDQLCSSLNKWVKAAKCDSAILFATDSNSNYRLDLAYTEDYKGQRTDEKPPFFCELKNAMVERLGCRMSNGNEADDDLSITAMMMAESLGLEVGTPMHKELCPTVTCSSDKDSSITPTWHYNPDTGKLKFTSVLGTLEPKYKNAMVNHYEYIGTGQFYTRGANAGKQKTKRVLVGKKPSEAITKLGGSGLKFFYAQLIMGDTADNYSGLPNRGMTYAYNLLDSCKSERELYMAVLGAYKEVYGTGLHRCENFRGGYAMLTAYDRMLEQGRMAWMQQKPNQIWREGKGQVISGTDKEFWYDNID